jgi:chemotaxis protein histidine kinase CheA
MAPVAQGAEAGGASAAATDVARDALKESGPFGGCEPIGLTASGELVFPLDCKKLIKKPAEAPVAADDKAATDDRTASTDAKIEVKTEAKPAQSSQSATAEAKPAANKPVANEAAAAAQPVPAAEEKQATAVDKTEAAPKAAALDPAAAAKPASSSPANGRVAPIKPGSAKAMSGRNSSGAAGADRAAQSRTASGNAPGKPSTGKPSTSTPSTGKASSAKAVVVAVKDAAPKSGQSEPPKAIGKETSKPTTMSAIRSMIVMAKPANTGTPVAARSQAEERPRRTAGLPACVQFRSYNPATRSYRGFDGHTYACR